MNSKFGRSVISALCVGITICLAAIATPAQDYQQAYSQPYPQSYAQPYSQPPLSPRAGSNGNEVDKALEGSADAANIFRDIAIAPNKIPQDVLLNAAAIGVFKGVFNPAFIGGHHQGNGAITFRTPGGWSAPVFYKMRGASVSLQAGDSLADYLLIFMSRESMRDLADGEFDLKLDGNAAPGPILGAEVIAGRPEFPKSKTVFVYSRSNESFAGAVIDDARLMARDGVNRDLYGMNALALLSDPSPLPNMCAACLSPGVSDFPETVTADVPGPQPASVTVAQPQTTTREYLALTRGAPRNRNRGVKLIVIRIIKDDDDDEDEDEDEVVVEVVDQPQPQPLRVINCCPRPHKRKH